jgi:hypothetical protein
MTAPILAIDPGPEQSAYVLYVGNAIYLHGIITNEQLRDDLENMRDCDYKLVIEQVAAMGMAVGAEVFETVFWSGRFVEAWGGEWDRVKRHEVKMHLCGNMRAKDANIRQALLDKFGPGKAKAVGTKRQPGPLYGIKSHCWAALAVAVTYAERASKETP